MDMTNHRVGSVLAGKYKIKSMIGKGGMGTVYLATHIPLGKPIAVKIFHSHLVENRQLSARFVKEARGAAVMNHRNIIDIIDIGLDEDHVPFFVMEYLKGESLKSRLEQQPQGLSISESADIMIQLLTGLHVAHGNGVIHRDMKPGNIFIAKEADGSEIVKILDFGIARFRELEVCGRAEVTTNDIIFGTPSYMSPEQAMGRLEEIDHRTDIYSCGVILYRCLTGINPFKGSTQLETIQNVIHFVAPPPSSLSNHLGADVDLIALKAIEKQKENRYPDCKSFIEALTKIYEISNATPAESVKKIVRGEVKLERVGADADETVSQYPVASLEQSEEQKVIALKRPVAAGGKGTRSRNLIMIVLLTILTMGLAYWAVSRTPAGLSGPGPGSLKAQETKEPQAPMKGGNAPVETPRSFVTLDLMGPDDDVEVFIGGVLHKERPLRVEKADRQVPVVILRHGEELMRTSITPLENLKLLVGASSKTGKPMEKLAPKKKGETGKTVQDKGKAPSISPAGPDATSSGDTKEPPRKIFKVFPK